VARPIEMSIPSEKRWIALNPLESDVPPLNVKGPTVEERAKNLFKQPDHPKVFLDNKIAEARLGGGGPDVVRAFPSTVRSKVLELHVVAICRRYGCIHTGASPMRLPKSRRSPSEMDERIVAMIASVT
jgi:hypothetical protein